MGTWDLATQCSCPDRDLGHPLPSHRDPADVSGLVSGPRSHRSSADRRRAGRSLPALSLPGTSQLSGKRWQGDHKTKVHAANLSFWPELVLNPPGWEGLGSQSPDLPGAPEVGVRSHPHLQPYFTFNTSLAELQPCWSPIHSDAFRIIRGCYFMMDYRHCICFSPVLWCPECLGYNSSVYLFYYPKRLLTEITLKTPPLPTARSPGEAGGDVPRQVRHARSTAQSTHATLVSGLCGLGGLAERQKGAWGGREGGGAGSVAAVIHCLSQCIPPLVCRG